MDVLVGSTIILGIWAAVGPLVGVRYGSELSARATKRQWVAGNKKQEYREILATMESAYTSTLRSLIPMRAGPAQLEERERAEAVSLETLRNRLFVREELDAENIIDLWTDALVKAGSEKDINHFSEAYESIERTIRRLAVESIK